jgi:hypothetical protein
VGRPEDGPRPPAGLGLQDPHHPPPPEYTSPPRSDPGDESRRNSSSSEREPLVRVSRSRGGSSATVLANQGRHSGAAQDGPPIPSYQDAVQQNAAERSQR